MWGSKKTKKAAPAKKAAVGKAPKKAMVKKTSGSSTKVAKTAPKVTHSYDTIFKVYATDEDMGKPVIGSEGIVNLAGDWNLDLASSLELLVFMWYCDCEEYGRITFTEFENGCKKLEVKDFSDFKSRVPSKLSQVLKDVTSSTFRPFYKFVFCFHREGGAKNVELAT